MEETVTGYVSVRELNEFLDRMEEAGDRCKDEWIGGAVTATTGVCSDRCTCFTSLCCRPRKSQAVGPGLLR